MPTIEELEKEKLRLEIEILKKGEVFPWETLFGALQVIAVIIGVFLTVSEFKSKTQDKTLEKTKISLEYVSKISDREISASRDSLHLYQSRLRVALSDPEFDRLFEKNSADFEKNTAPLANYYSVLQSEIEKGYFDRELCTAFLDHIVTRDIQSLYEIQTHHGGLRNNRPRPDYR